MRPPAQRHAPKGEMQLRPHFEAAKQLAPAAPQKGGKINEDSPMERACHRPHELVVTPLLSDLRYRESGLRAVPSLQGGANHPYLARKPQPHRQHIISTYN